MVTLTPAYGRDYKSQKEVKADWKGGKDFIIADIVHPYSGKPCSIRDAEALGGKVMIRFNKNTKIVAV
tara:strand:+ start:971 stop:1174 length:204 start_codon:yes stop_codon:yes gene_type:complete